MYELMRKQFQQLDDKKKKKKRGFTLIELIIVIAILAILAAILVPLMIGWINEAKAATADANARTLYTAATAALTSLMAASNYTSADTIKGAGAAPTLTNGVLTVGTTSQMAVSDMTAAGFQEDIKDLLGDNFTGYVSVVMTDGGTANAAVSLVTWSSSASANEIVGSYPAATTERPTRISA